MVCVHTITAELCLLFIMKRNNYHLLNIKAREKKRRLEEKRLHGIVNKKRILTFTKYNLWLIVLDIIAFNLSYFLALIMRFYVNGEFRPTVYFYLSDWISFTPYYTIAAVIVFFFCRLYSALWRFFGLNDMNRIIGANIATTVVMIAGTLIFIRRMPITYYGIGAVLQFLFTLGFRVASRIILEEKQKMKKTDRLPVLVIGSGDLSKNVIRHLEEGNVYQPVRIIGQNAGQMLNGIPIVSYDKLADSLEQVKAIYIADKDITPEQREAINSAAGDREIFDYTGVLSNITGVIPLTGVLEKITGPVIIEADGQEKAYKSGREALEGLHARYLITGIRGDKLTIKLVRDDGLAYLRQYQEETGEEVSFF